MQQAPFCVHPKTGKVCVPLDPAAVDGFDPDDVPTVTSLLGELAAAAAKVSTKAAAVPPGSATSEGDAVAQGQVDACSTASWGGKVS